VLVRIAAVALNRLDLFVMGGLPGAPGSFPHVLGSDGAGTVQRVGEGVTGFQPGDRVMINPTISCDRCPACLEGEQCLCENLQVLGEHVAGAAAELVLVPADNLGLIPEGMPWSQAAAFSLATLTAWRMLKTRAQLQDGESVLIWGIGGGVAMAALQVARLLGGRTIVTSRDRGKLETAKRAGANHLLESGAEVPAEVRRLTSGRGADVVIDSVGEQTWGLSLRSLRRGGRMVVCGATSGPMVSLDLRRLFWRQWSLLGSTLGSRQEYAEIVALAGQGQLWPLVDEVVPLDRAVEAYERMNRGEQVGKLVIEVGT
jgi:NADPH:quinone reductase-like Zn-dependent oxidoreductase